MSEEVPGPIGHLKADTGGRPCCHGAKLSSSSTPLLTKRHVLPKTKRKKSKVGQKQPTTDVILLVPATFGGDHIEPQACASDIEKRTSATHRYYP